ncbi:polysaccharide pyruvyl transferase CsaB [Paenibacillus campi]|uniref:polysaccharide pyruvyl transferase CsaB n=1 Tax=Paenibacillus campi TaxID=3106031 RepID=UPI002AFFC1B2|nr:polysaccharide pyruvyl transferase CsaB [Paenibacillus sp. SGZ-1014]
MGSVSVQIVISGYYGFRNSGDEAVLKSILNSLAQQGEAAGIQIVPVVLSNDPEWTARMYNVRSVHRMKLGEIRALMKESDGLISGGGSLLQDATGPLTIPYYLGIIHIAQWARKPVFIYAQGVGPVQKGFFFKWIRNVFRKSVYVSVRDQESAALLGRMGLDQSRIAVVADPVMGLPLPDDVGSTTSPNSSSAHNYAGEVSGGTGHSSAEDDRIRVAVDSTAPTSSVSDETNVQSVPLIGISLRFWDKQRRELDGIAAALQQLVRQRRVQLRFLPFHLPEDEQASAYVIERIGELDTSGSTISIAEQVVDPQQMLAEVSRCDLVLGMRLHSLIYAASQHVPLLGISYDPKIDQFLNRLAIEPSGTSESVQPDRLLTHMLDVLDASVEWKRSKATYIAALKQDAAQPAQFIAHYFLEQR